MESGIKIVTAAFGTHSINYVPAAMDRATGARCPDIALTKRRAVDFCHVATAICPAVQLRRAC